MNNALNSTSTAGTGASAPAPVLPLQLLQPLDATHPLSTPASTGGPEQRLTVTPDPGVGMELDLRPTRLLISKDGQSRSIWPVHLAGWQALGWQLHAPQEIAEVAEAMEEPAAIAPPPPATPLQPDQAEPSTIPAPPMADLPPAAAGEALLAGEEPNFQAMTKAEITAFCAQTFGVSLDGSMTKAELVATATGLLQEATGQGAEAAATTAEPAAAKPGAGEGPAAEAPELELALDLGPAGADPEFPDDLL
jgi:hypothetical protein